MRHSSVISTENFSTSRYNISNIIIRIMRTTIVACLIAGASAFGTLICEEEDGDAAALFH